MQDVTRTCRRCKVSRPLADFYIEAEARALARRGRPALKHCRHCQRDDMMARRAPRQAIADEAKRKSGCVDCGLRPEVLQVLEFDHREDEEKLFDVSDRMTSGNLDDLRREIAKCDVVCANCHRIRTVKRNQFGATFGGRRVVRSQILRDNANGLAHIWNATHVDLSARRVENLHQPGLF